MMLDILLTNRAAVLENLQDFRDGLAQSQQARQTYKQAKDRPLS